MPGCPLPAETGHVHITVALSGAGQLSTSNREHGKAATGRFVTISLICQMPVECSLHSRSCSRPWVYHRVRDPAWLLPSHPQPTASGLWPTLLEEIGDGVSAEHRIVWWPLQSPGNSPRPCCLLQTRKLMHREVVQRRAPGCGVGVTVTCLSAFQGKVPFRFLLKRGPDLLILPFFCSCIFSFPPTHPP